MYNMKKEKAEKSSVKKNIPFYISLAICLAAVFGAAWTTYGNIEDYMEPAAESSEEPSAEQKVNEEISGQRYQRAESSAEESSKAESEQSSEDEKEDESSVDTAPVQTEVSENEPVKPDAVFPIEKGEIVKPFSIKNPLKSLTMNDWRTHGGIDISAGDGAAVKAVLDGEVESLYHDALLGNVIRIAHEGDYTVLYCGVTDTSVVKEGDHVSAGDTIAYVGKIPSEIKDAPHLHIELCYKDSPVDPESIFKQTA